MTDVDQRVPTKTSFFGTKKPGFQASGDGRFDGYDDISFPGELFLFVGPFRGLGASAFLFHLPRRFVKWL